MSAKLIILFKNTKYRVHFCLFSKTFSEMEEMAEMFFRRKIDKNLFISVYYLIFAVSYSLKQFAYGIKTK